VVSLIQEMEKRDLTKGLVALCGGGGHGQSDHCGVSRLVLKTLASLALHACNKIIKLLSYPKMPKTGEDNGNGKREEINRSVCYRIIDRRRVTTLRRE